MKKSGLADSPFFNKSTLLGSTTPVSDAPTPPEIIPIYENTQVSERVNVRSNEQVNGNENVQTNERSKVATEDRPIARKSYDVHLDQDADLDRLRIVISQKRRTFVSKGQVARIALDIGLERLKKRYSAVTPQTQKI